MPLLMSAADKRTPTLADRFCARRFAPHKRVIEERTMARLQQRVRSAHRYVFDEAAAKRLGEVVRRVPELLMREHRFARAPFDLTWVEFPHWLYYDVLTEGRPEVRDGVTREWTQGNSDHTIGYLIDHGSVVIVSGGLRDSPMSPPIVTPFQYHLHSEWSVEDQIDFARRAHTSRGQIDRYLWGSTALDISESEIRSLRESHRLDMLPLDLRFNKRLDSKVLEHVLRGGAGELRNIIAILLMLNRPTIARYRNELPGMRGWHKGKLIPYLSHTTVTIDIDAVPVLRLIGTPAGEGVPRRAHEVEGHFCHDQTARDFMRIAGCIHEFQPTRGPEDDWTPWPNAPLGSPGAPGCARNWVCSVCGGKRWFIKEHLRGDATRGVVIAKHEVTASRR